MLSSDCRGENGANDKTRLCYGCTAVITLLLQFIKTQKKTMELLCLFQELWRVVPTAWICSGEGVLWVTSTRKEKKKNRYGRRASQ